MIIFCIYIEYNSYIIFNNQIFNNEIIFIKTYYYIIRKLFKKYFYILFLKIIYINKKLNISFIICFKSIFFRIFFIIIFFFLL